MEIKKIETLEADMTRQLLYADVFAHHMRDYLGVGPVGQNEAHQLMEIREGLTHLLQRVEMIEQQEQRRQAPVMRPGVVPARGGIVPLSPGPAVPLLPPQAQGAAGAKRRKAKQARC